MGVSKNGDGHIKWPMIRNILINPRDTNTGYTIVSDKPQPQSGSCTDDAPFTHWLEV